MTWNQIANKRNLEHGSKKYRTDVLTAEQQFVRNLIEAAKAKSNQSKDHSDLTPKGWVSVET